MTGVVDQISPSEDARDEYR